MKPVFFFLISFLCGFCKPTNTFSQNHPIDSCCGQTYGDSIMRLNLYDSTNGPHWKHNSGWLNYPILDSYFWYGIGFIITNIGGVADTDYNMGGFPLDLNNNNLVGPIPRSIFNGTFFSIDLSNNSLTGTIPDFPNTYGPEGSGLDSLFLQRNQLTGSVPAWLNNTFCPAIDLSYNQLSGPFPAASYPLTYAYTGGNGVDSIYEGDTINMYLAINNNKFTFDGIEDLARVWGGISFNYSIDDQIDIFNFDYYDTIANPPTFLPAIVYAPQDSIPTHYNGTDSILSVSAGGTLSNNTYTWYLNNQVDTVIVGDSTRKARKSGTYYVAVTNSIATKLTLYSKVYATPSQFQLIDPNPSMVKQDGTLDTTIANIDYSKTVIGGATDGVTKILLVSTTNATIDFSLANAADGGLSTLEDEGSPGAVIGASETVASDDGKVVAVYTVPDGYGTNNPAGPRKITITATDHSNPSSTTNISIQLVTPPIILVHGMWSKPAIWETGGFTNAINNATGYQEVPNQNGLTGIFLADYSNYSASTFDPLSSASKPGRDAVSSAIQSGLKAFRGAGYAVTQADIVGHSLGGLMARSFSQQGSAFSNPSNYDLGYIHKLITLGTPHKGSPLGPFLYNFGNVIINLRGSTLSIPTVLGLLFTITGQPIGLCLRDFNENGTVLQNNLLQTPPFYTYAIGGNYTGNTLNTAGYLTLSALMSEISGMDHDDVFGAVAGCPVASEPDNDIIVPMYSQMGGAAQGKIFPATAHSVPGYTTETNNSVIQDSVIQLLLSNNTSRFNIDFSAASNIADDCGSPTVNASVNAAAKNGSVVTLGTAAAKATAGIKTIGGQSVQVMGGTGPVILGGDSGIINPNLAVEIISPINSALFQPGGTDSLTLQYQPLNGAVPVSGQYILQGIGWYSAPTAPPYSVKVALPAAGSLGKVTIALIVRDTSGAILADTTSIVLTPTGILDSLSVAPGSISLDSSLRVASVAVEGFYGGGRPYSMADITDGAAGTGYSAQKGTAVFSVTTAGVVTAIHPGTDTLLIVNSGLSIKVPVNVDSNFALGTMYPNTIDFQPIPDKVVADPAFALAATSSAAGAINFTIVSGNATVQNGIVTITGPGPVAVKAAQAGDAYFSAATVTQTFCVNPGQPGTITGDTASCLGNQTYSLSTISGIQYKWTVSEGGTVTGNDSSAVIHWTATGKHIVSATPMADSCAGAAATLTVTVTGPVQPVITQSGSILKSSIDSGNQWFLDSVAIPGAVDSVYHPTVPGNYSAEVTIDSCVSPMSNSVVFDTTGSAGGDSTMTIYPNPFGNTITIANQSGDGISIQLFDMLGRLLLEQINGSGTVQLATGNLAHGCYIIVITDEVTKKRSRKLLMK
jgi:pimeloyl-ACP methyl ester carboxylesterase